MQGQTQGCALSQKLPHTQQHGSFEQLSQPENGLEKAVLEGSMSMPIKLLVELVFLMLCVPRNTLLLHAGVYL